jgi:hypothetical protein
MAEWIITVVAVLGVIISVIGFFMKLQSIDTRNKAEHEHIFAGIKDLRSVIGNGDGRGLRGELAEMKIQCAGHMAAVDTKVAALEKDKEKHNGKNSK